MFFGLILDIIFQPQISVFFMLAFLSLTCTMRVGFHFTILLLPEEPIFVLLSVIKVNRDLRKPTIEQAFSPASHTYQDMNVRHFYDIRV